jgi:iron complex transport system ATP-binding protein
MRGMGIVLSVHELNLAAMYADSASLLRDGRLIAQGATSEVLTAPLLEHLYGPGLSFTTQHGPTSTQWLATPRAMTVV